MPGIFGVVSPINAKTQLTSLHDEMLRLRDGRTELFSDMRMIGNVGLGLLTNSTFTNMKGFHENGNLVTVFDGVLFATAAKQSLVDQPAFSQVASQRFRKNGEMFARDLRGNFVFAIYDKTSQILRLYVDHFSSKPLYYFKEGSSLYFSSELKGLLPIGEGQKRVDVSALREAFAMGYVCGDKTLVKGIRQLTAGSTIVYHIPEARFEIKDYYKLDKKNLDLPEEKLLKQLKSTFYHATDIALSTTVDNGYTPLLTLSGGLDSRAVCAVATKLGYQPLYSLNFSQAGSSDDVYGGQAAHVLKTHHLFEPYGSGDWLVNCLDTAVMAGEGMYHYIDCARMAFALPPLDPTRFGILHTGVVGGFILGSLYMTQFDMRQVGQTFSREQLSQVIMPRYSSGYLSGLQCLIKKTGDFDSFFIDLQSSIIKTFSSSILESDWVRAIEMWSLSNRQIRGIFGYYRGCEQFMEYSSPFLDPDFFEVAFNLPHSHRFKTSLGHKFFAKEVYGNNLSKVPWQKTGAPITAGTIAERGYSLRKFIKEVLLPRINTGYWRKSSANPWTYWIWHNEELRNVVKNELNDFEQVELLGIDRGKLAKFLHKLSVRPARFDKSSHYLLYLMPLKRWFDSWGKYVS